MLAIDWAKIDKFYIVFVFVMIAMAVMVIFTFRGIFSAYNLAYEIDQASLDNELRINKDQLSEAHDFVFNTEAVPLQLKF